MQLRGAVLLVGLLTGVLLAGVAPASLADPSDGSRRVESVSARLVPRVVAEGEPAVVVGKVTPAAAGVDLVVQRYEDGAWTTYAEARTDGRGAYQAPLATASPSATRYRVAVAAGAPVSGPVELQVTPRTQCGANPPPVDPEATGEVHCLLQRLDRWRSFGLMGAGQQLNVSSAEAFAPLEALDGPVAVVGFDLEELATSGTYAFPFLDEQVDRLLTLADQGAILAATWHAHNPFPGKVRLRALLDETSPAGARFWADYDEKLELLARFQDGDGGRHDWAPVVFRPFHEANGNWFWWGRPDPRVFKKLWKRMQGRAWDAGVHNVVWSFSANRVTSAAKDPRPLVPRRVDLGGLDSYDPEKGAANAKDRLWLEGWSRVAPEVSRMALTEVGPHGSRDGDWDPAVVTRTVRQKGLRPAWAMLWFDDGSGRDGISGLKQIASLDGGPAWLRSCPNGLCTVG